MSGNMDWLHHDRIVAFTSLRLAREAPRINSEFRGQSSHKSAGKS